MYIIHGEFAAFAFSAHQQIGSRRVACLVAELVYPHKGTGFSWPRGSEQKKKSTHENAEYRERLQYSNGFCGILVHAVERVCHTGFLSEQSHNFLASSVSHPHVREEMEGD